MASTAPLIHHSQIEDQIEAMHQIGYAYIPQALTLEQVAELKQLYDEGVITEDEFKSAKKKLLNL